MLNYKIKFMCKENVDFRKWCVSYSSREDFDKTQGIISVLGLKRLNNNNTICNYNKNNGLLPFLIIEGDKYYFSHCYILYDGYYKLNWSRFESVYNDFITISVMSPIPFPATAENFFVYAKRSEQMSDLGISLDHLKVRDFIVKEIDIPDLKLTTVGCIGNMLLNSGSLNSQQEQSTQVMITLTKAKEWYKAGGELREVALQAFKEEKLKEKEILTWDDLQIKAGGNFYQRVFTLPSDQKQAKSMEAFAKLSHLLEIYNGPNWKCDFGKNNISTVIVNRNGKAIISSTTSFVRFLVLKNTDIASKFLNNNLELINDYFMIDGDGK